MSKTTSTDPWMADVVFLLQCRLLFQQILHCTSKNSGKPENGFGAGFVDVLVALLVHLNRPKADIASSGKLRLRAAIERADALEVGISEVLAYFGIGNIGELADVRFVERRIHPL